MIEVILISMLISLFWGIGAVGQKWLLNCISVKAYYIYASLILAIVGLGYFLIYYKEGIIHAHTMKPKHIVILIATVLIGGTIANLMFAYVLSTNNNTSVATALSATYPMFTLILAYYLLKENIDKKSIIGVILITAGIMLLSANL